jgi:phytoene dehydrogenase-like protein
MNRRGRALEPARDPGADIRLEAPVERILVVNERVRGAALASGEEIAAPIVVAATHPQITFLRQLDASELPDRFVEDIRNWKSRSGTVKINLALDRAPVFTAKPDQTDLTGGFELAHSIAYLERAFEEARNGRAATAPFSDGNMPTYADPTLAPEGKHIVSLFTQWCPAEWADDPDDVELEAYADRVIAGYDELARVRRQRAASPGARPA